MSLADVEVYKVKDLWLELDMMSPVSIPGSYAITVALYDGGEPVVAACSAAQVQSQFQVYTQMQTTCQTVQCTQIICVSARKTTPNVVSNSSLTKQAMQ